MNEGKIKTELLRDVKKLRVPEGYLLAGILMAGISNYMGLLGRDSLIGAWQLLKIFPEIAKNTLKILVKFQGEEVNARREEEPGKFPHEYYPKYSEGWFRKQDVYRDLGEFPHYGSIDSTIWFLIVSSFYYQETKDADLIKEIWPNIEEALKWMENYGDRDGDGFIEYQRMNPKGPPPCGWNPHQGWKEGLSLDIKQPVAIVEVQGYAYLAYKAISELALDIFGKRDGYLKEKAKDLRTKFNRAFWMEKEGFFALGLDGDKKQIKDITSNPGHLLFTGIIDDEKVDFVVKRLFREDLWTPFGIRTLSSDNSQFDPLNPHQGAIWPHDNWLIYKGLERCGYNREAENIRQSQILVYKKLGCVPEYYGVKNGEIAYIPGVCCPQAWATGGLLEMIG